MRKIISFDTLPVQNYQELPYFHGDDLFEENGYIVPNTPIKITKSQFMKQTKERKHIMKGTPISKIHLKYLSIEKKKSENEYEELYTEFETLVSRFQANKISNPYIKPPIELIAQSKYKEFQFIIFDSDLDLDHMFELEKYIKNLNKEICFLSNIVIEYKSKLFAFIIESMKDYSKRHNIRYTSLSHNFKHS